MVIFYAYNTEGLFLFFIQFPLFCRDSEPSSSSRSAAPPNYAPPLLPPETEGGHVSSPIDPQREASRVKREQRRERDREHHRESRGSAQRGSRGHARSDRESSVPHSEQEYAISTKARGQSNGQRQSNKSRERSRGSGSGGGHGGRSGENNNGGRSGENNSERPLSQHEQQLAVTTAGITDINLEPCKFFQLVN